ncbi:toll/interleukin-1 receptor domain-containing protein [Actinokineospora guangxiensis]|uniref:Toll/interleukin-1 receptor domain-containing protein n=1 Tax=Actinokineospora guangxiensis TaxID=1490288 RepID=A0ABW0EL36_9PSEU
MRVFINYRTGDSRGAAVLVSTFLSERLGEDNVFLDGRSIEPGTLFDHELLRRVWRSDVLVAVIGPNWLTAKTRGGLDITHEDDWVRKELAEAFSHQVKVIPVLVDDAQLPRQQDLPDAIADLARCQFIRLDLVHSDSAFQRLAAAVGAPERAAARATPAPPSGGGTTVTGTATVTGDRNTTITGVHIGDGGRWR